MRALWTTASGLTSQQYKLDLLANNMANVDSVGYKAQNASFQDLLEGASSTLPETDQENALTPRTGAPDLRFPNGVRLLSQITQFTQGDTKQTNQPFDLSIQGDGFFQLIAPSDVNKPQADRQPIFTRDGHFHVDSSGNLLNDAGYHVVDQNTGDPIKIDTSQMPGATVTIDGSGNIQLTSNGQSQTVGTIDYVLFHTSPDANLTSIGDSMYALKPSQLPLSGRLSNAASLVSPADQQRIGKISQGTLEMSNVNLGQTMSSLIEVQRAYQLDAKALDTENQMMEMSNNMRA